MADLPCGFVAIHDWHVAVHQHQVKGLLLQPTQRLAAVARNHHFTAQLAQHALGHQLVDRIVFDQQDSRAVDRRSIHGLSALYLAVVLEQQMLQGLVQCLTRQGPGFLLQGCQRIDLVTGHKVAIRGHQQDRRTDGRAQAKQALGTVGNQ